MDSLVDRARAELARWEARDAEVRAQLSQLEAELSGIQHEKLRIQTFLDLAQEMASRFASGSASTSIQPVEVSQPVPNQGANSVDKTGIGGTVPTERPRFFGQSLPVAAASLIQDRGQPLTETEILEGLEAGGLKMVSVKPHVNLRFALRRRPDLVRYEDGKWHTVVDVTTVPLPQTGAVSNRSPEMHLLKTMEGMANARERGVIGGRRRIFDAEQRERVFALRSAGKSATEISKAVGVSKSLIYLWLRNAQSEEAGVSDADEQSPGS